MSLFFVECNYTLHGHKLRFCHTHLTTESAEKNEFYGCFLKGLYALCG
jgi:hypothetical protein